MNIMELSMFFFIRGSDGYLTEGGYGDYSKLFSAGVLMRGFSIFPCTTMQEPNHIGFCGSMKQKLRLRKYGGVGKKAFFENFSE